RHERQQPFAVLRRKEDDASRSDLQAALDEELSRLPEKLRIPLVLRYLEEKTQDEVARVLGCSRRAVQKRFARGQAILRERLERRGLTLGAGSLVALLGSSAGASTVPARLIENTARAVMAFRDGTLSGGVAEGAQKLLRSLAVESAIQKVWWVVLA